MNILLECFNPDKISVTLVRLRSESRREPEGDYLIPEGFGIPTPYT